MNKPRDGGPAFPVSVWDVGLKGPVIRETIQGMSLRDWFAGQVECLMSYHDGTWLMDGNGPMTIAEMIGRRQPSGNLQSIKWWAEAEATIRYLKADAMLAERAK
jgi:hypothetical protein